MTTHIFQFRFADAEQYWLFRLWYEWIHDEGYPFLLGRFVGDSRPLLCFLRQMDSFTVGAKCFRCEVVLLQPSLIYQCDGDISKGLAPMPCSQVAFAYDARKCFTRQRAHPLRKLTYELLFGNIFTVGPNCPIALALAVWIRTQSSIDVESSAKVKTYTKRVGYAGVLCTSLFEFPDGNISTFGTKRFRYAEVLCTSLFCCCSRS